MNKGMFSKIMLLASIVALSGCASAGAQLATDNGPRPILSAAEVESMIRVTVVKLPPPEEQEERETIVAAAD